MVDMTKFSFDGEDAYCPSCKDWIGDREDDHERRMEMVKQHIDEYAHPVIVGNVYSSRK